MLALVLWTTTASIRCSAAQWAAVVVHRAEPKELNLSRETIRHLEARDLAGIAGAAKYADTRVMNTCAPTYYIPCTNYKCGPTWTLIDTCPSN